jgi:hypothetical protein
MESRNSSGDNSLIFGIYFFKQHLRALAVALEEILEVNWSIL